MKDTQVKNFVRILIITIVLIFFHNASAFRLCQAQGYWGRNDQMASDEECERSEKMHPHLRKMEIVFPGADLMTGAFGTVRQGKKSFPGPVSCDGMLFASNETEEIESLDMSYNDQLSLRPRMSPQFGVPIDVRDFALGVEYLPLLPLAGIYGDVGVKWAKSAGIEWNRIEPRPPDEKGRHSYRWAILDRVILDWQRAGVNNLQLWLKCTAQWATSPVRTRKRVSLTRRSSSPPKEDYWDDYADFVRNVVERYDKDGEHDAPGLLYPVHHFQIEAEVQHHGQWQGTADEYLKLLATAYDAAKRTNPQAKIILSGLTFVDIADDMPSREALLKRIKEDPRLSRQFEINERILSRPDIFDYVAFNYLTDYKAIYGITDWIRHQMRKHGYEKPIWASDAFSGLLIYHNDLNTPVPSSSTRQNIFNALENATNGSDGEYVRWFRSYQSAVMTKKVLASMELGLVGINVGNTRDWTEAWNFPSHYQKSTAPMGLVDLEIRRRQIVSWKGRPAYYALKFLTGLLKDVETITRLKGPEGVFAYHMIRKDKSLFAMWYDPNKVALPGDKMAQKRVAFRTENTNMRLSSVIVDYGQQSAEWEDLTATGETFSCTLSEMPVFIEGSEELTFVDSL
ncbi:MAG: hypothetical protein SV775_10080 [Thermodesulfobacteriota bacterium]|nr:hypothetical protein [Thermodesulfobacteriota bacterium]